MGQIIWTHGDSGDTQFNYSKLIGNSISVAISNAYYSDNRTASDAVSKLGIQPGFDAAANVLKEFWPASIETLAENTPKMGECSESRNDSDKR